MNQLIKYGRDKLIVGLVSLLSASFVSRGPFETNPQDCEMTIMVKRKILLLNIKILRVKNA